MPFVVTAQVVQSDGSLYTVIQTPDQTVRLFVTTVAPGRGIVTVRRSDGYSTQFSAAVAADSASALNVGDEATPYLRSLAFKGLPAAA